MKRWLGLWFPSRTALYVLPFLGALASFVPSAHAACQVGSSVSCTTEEGCDGVRYCEDLYYGECMRKDPNVCRATTPPAPYCGDGKCNGSESACSCGDCSLSREQTLAARYAPVLKFSSGEGNFPSDIDFYLSRVRMQFSYDDSCDDSGILLWEGGGVNRTTLLDRWMQTKGAWFTCSLQSTWRSSSQYYGGGDEYFLTIPEDNTWQNVTRSGDIWNADTYYHAYHRGGGLVIQYWNFYPYNGGFAGIGAHEGDWEHVSVYIPDGSDTPSSMYFAQHETGESIPWSQVEQHLGHPVVYVAEATHASYPRSGTSFPMYQGQPRADTHNGTSWWLNTWTQPLVQLGGPQCGYHGQNWLSYGGHWGELGPVSSGPYSPIYQSAWSNL